MKTIKHILSRYTRWLWSILGPLGPWGVFVVSAVDGCFVGLPTDAVMATYIYQDRARLVLYVLLASLGSAVGSSVLYLIGYLGGEGFLRRRIPAAKFDKIHRSFEKHEFWALMFPAMLPPPTPFKLFVLAAAVAEMSFTHFFLAIFLGKAIRFTILALLVVKFGPEVVHLLGTVFVKHYEIVLLIVAAAALAWFLRQRRQKQIANQRIART